MNKIIWLILALIVPSLGMAQSKSVLDGLKPDQCAGVKDGKYISMPCQASASTGAENAPILCELPLEALLFIGAANDPIQKAAPTWDGDIASAITINPVSGISLNGYRVAAGGAPPQHSKPHLRATATAGTVTVQWTDTSAGPGVGFFIYKGTTSGGESGTPLNSSPVDVGQACLTTAAYCTYNDTPTPGVQACYTVAANNSSGTSAKASPDACVTVPIPIPAVPVLGPPIMN